jgi:FkbM family methyltransferase
MWFSQLADGAAIVAIEPGQNTSDRLRSNLRRNGLLGKVEVVKLAVGKENGVGYLISGEHSALARTQSMPADHSEIVEVAGLERVVELAGGRVDLMKIDCEGSEYGFFESASPEILGTIGSIVGEYHPANAVEQAKLFEHLELSGFQCLVTPDGFIDGLEQGTFMAWRNDSGLLADEV